MDLHPHRTPPLRRRALLTLAATALLAPLSAAQAQAYPTKPITLIVPWPAGGCTDRHLRALAEIAGKHLGQNIIVENQPGGGGTLGPGQMALNAKPDGYTIAQFPMGMLRLPHMQKMAWDPLNDFSFIIGVSRLHLRLRRCAPTRRTRPSTTTSRRRARQPGKIDYGSTGIGTSPHLLMEELADAAKVQLNHVPVQGQRRPDAGAAGRPRDGASDATGWDKFVDGGQMRLLVTFGEQAHQALAHRAHRQGPGLRRGLAPRPTAWSAPRAWTRRW